MSALVTQTCVVTLEPFEARVEEPFEVEFAPQAVAEAAYERAMAEIEAAHDKAAALAEQRDPPDAIINGKVNLGALASEFLAMGLDPHPRKPGARFDDAVAPAQDEKASPFSVLAGFRKRTDPKPARTIFLGACQLRRRSYWLAPAGNWRGES